MPVPARQIISCLSTDGKMTVEVVATELPDPGPDKVIVEIAGAPINPSDISGLLGPAVLDQGDYSPGKLVTPVPEQALKAYAGRVGQAMTVGNECAGTVIAAGDDPSAQALLGKRVCCWTGGGSFASHVAVDASACTLVPEGASIANAAASYVNPMTALGFVGTLKREGYKALVHTASASNLGQMLNRICQEDGIPIVNVVRKPEQVELLKAMDAQYVLNSSDADFLPQMADAVAATGAYCCFDAVGGGELAGTILAAMEQAANRAGEYSRYGSAQPKHIYIYGKLDVSPLILPPTIGFSWGVSTWLLFPYLREVGPQEAQAMRERIMAGIDTTFASHFSREVTLEGMLERDAIRTINAKTTGEKYLIRP